jgi:hypothetical protein
MDWNGELALKRKTDLAWLAMAALTALLVIVWDV